MYIGKLEEQQAATVRTRWKPNVLLLIWFAGVVQPVFTLSRYFIFYSIPSWFRASRHGRPCYLPGLLEPRFPLLLRGMSSSVRVLRLTTELAAL